VLLHWLEFFPSKDGHVRVAKVLLGQNVLVRPISKLCSLEIETCESDQKDVKLDVSERHECLRRGY
jgi:hypothetical protein